MRKMGLFWFAAALLGAALIFAGCPTEADTETVTVREGVTNTLLGLQALLDKDGINYVEFVGHLIIGSNDVFVIPDGKTVKVDGDVTVDGILAVGGTLTLPGVDDKITNNGTVIGSDEFLKGKVTGGQQYAGVASLPTTPEGVTAIIGGITAVKDLTLETTDTTPFWYTQNLRIYVYGKLTVTGDATAPTAASVVAIKDVLINAGTATNVRTLNTTTVDVSAAILKNTAAATVTLPGEITLRGIDTGDATLTIAGAATSLTIGDLNGNVALPSALTAVTISGGTGNVTTAATSITGEATFRNTGDIDFTGATAAFTEAAHFAGEASFDGDATFSDTAKFIRAASFGGTATFSDTAEFDNNATFTGTATFATTSSFARTVVFGDDVTLTDEGATFSGTAFFEHGTTITLTTTDSIITLGPGAGLAVGTPSGNASDVYSMVIRNSDNIAPIGNLTLTPANDTTLAFDADGKGITQSGSITISGAAVLIPGSTYTVASESGAVGTLTLDSGATLELAAGALAEEDPSGSDPFESQLVLTGATSTDGAKLAAGTGGVKAGATTITGTWQAVASSGSDTVTIASASRTGSRITASADSVVFTADTDGVITQAAGDDNELTIGAATSIDLENAGTITLKAAESNGGSINLSTTTSKIIGLKGGTSNVTLVTTNIDNATYTVGTDTGEVTGGGTSGDGNAWIGGGHDTGPNPIKATDGAAADASISSTTLIGADT